MSDERRLFAAQGPTREAWGLGPLPPAQGSLSLIGWSRSLALATDDEPAPFATILASVLTRLGPVAFPNAEASLVTTSPLDGVVFVPWAPLRRSTSPSRLCLTSDAAVAANLFGDSAFPWGLQGQFALLCSQSVQIEALATFRGVLDTLIEPQWTTVLPTLNAAGVQAVLRPGTDGALAGLLTADVDLSQRLIVTLAEIARHSSVAFEMVDEAGFSAALAASFQ